MSNFYELAAFGSNDRYRLSSSQDSHPNAAQSYSYGLAHGSLDTSGPIQHRLSEDRAVDAPVVQTAAAVTRPVAGATTTTTTTTTTAAAAVASPMKLNKTPSSPGSQAAAAHRSTPNGSSSPNAGGVVTARQPARSPSLSVTPGTMTSPSPSSPPGSQGTAKPPPGLAPPRNGRAQPVEPLLRPAGQPVPPSLSNSNSASNSTRVSAMASPRPAPPTSTGPEAPHHPSEPKLVSLPRLSTGHARSSLDNSLTNASRRASVDRIPFDPFSAPANVTSAHTSQIGVPTQNSSAPTSVAKKPFAVPPLQPQSLDKPGAPTTGASTSQSFVPVHHDNSNSTAHTPASATAAAAQSVPVWLTQVNTQLSHQPLPRVTEPSAKEPTTPSGSIGGDSDWLNPTSRPATCQQRPGTNTFRNAALGGHTLGQPAMAYPMASAAGPAASRGPASRRQPAVANSDVANVRRFSSSRRPSGAETPHMGLAALRSDSASSNDASDVTDSLSMSRSLTRAAGSNLDPSFHDGFVSINHAQRHMTPISQRGAGSQYWSGDSHESGASVANGHRQLPVGKRQNSDLWSGNGSGLRPPLRGHPGATQAASMPARPHGTDRDHRDHSGGAVSSSGHGDVGPVRVPRENNFFSAVLQKRLSVDGSVLPPSRPAQPATTIGSRVQPLSLLPSNDDNDDTTGEQSFTDVSSRASGVSLNAETTYVAH